MLIHKKKIVIFCKNATTDFLFIRPSGNPIARKVFDQMISDDIVQEKAEKTKIHRFEFLSENIVMSILHQVQNLHIKGHLMMSCQQLHNF